MQERKKFSLYYFAYGVSFIALLLFIFSIMSSIEGMTSHLELKLYKRSLEDIVDQAYDLDLENRKDERVDFLVELTEFFYNFHQNTVLFKKKLEDFMVNRKVILNRLDRTDIKIYDLSILPNEKLSSYDMKPNPWNIPGETPRFRKQFPFSKVLSFSKSDLQFSVYLRERSDVYLLCMAQVKVTNMENSTLFRAQITEWNEKPDQTGYLRFYLKKNQSQIIQLHRILKIRDMKKARIILNGISNVNIQINKLEASCMGFFDIRALDKK